MVLSPGCWTRSASRCSGSRRTRGAKALRGSERHYRAGDARHHGSVVPNPWPRHWDRVFPSAADRFRSDIALALALVHHLVFTEGLPFGPIVDTISAFDSGGLVVEFVPPSDAHVIAWGREIPGWYSLETFVSELRRVYPTVEVVPSSPDPRVLLVCSR